MSQSKISVDDEKVFTMKHVFDNVDRMEEGGEMDGQIEYHYGIPWQLRLKKSCLVTVFFDCLVNPDCIDWSIDVFANSTVEKATKERHKTSKEEGLIFSPEKRSSWASGFTVADKEVTIKLTVRINKMSEKFKKKKLRNFGESSDKHSDVVLIVGDQKFHVNKMYLATHCTYFDSLLFGNFSESQKSEIELKDIDPEDFQEFLELIYGESTVEEFSVLKILHLAVFFDSKSAIRRCDVFLQEKSKLLLKHKFHAAIKYNLNALKEQCLSEMKTSGDFMSVVPDAADDFDPFLWKKLFLKSHGATK